MAEAKVAVVTGAAGGLGAEIAGQLSARGATVLATDLNEKALRDCAAKRKSRGEIVAHPADITDPDAVKGLIQAAIDRWGKLDALSNNAGIQGAVKPFVDYEDEELWRVMQANFYSCWLTMKSAIPHMVRGGGGAIVNTGSSLSNRGWKEVPAYVSSKHALLGLTRCVALEHGTDNIRVNLLCPASMDTPLLAPVATSTGGGDTELGYQRLRDAEPQRSDRAAGGSRECRGLSAFGRAASSFGNHRPGRRRRNRRLEPGGPPCRLCDALRAASPATGSAGRTSFRALVRIPVLAEATLALSAHPFAAPPTDGPPGPCRSRSARNNISSTRRPHFFGRCSWVLSFVISAAAASASSSTIFCRSGGRAR